MKHIKYLIKGIGLFLLFIILLPILLPLMLIDMLMLLGGADPMNTPIRRLLDKLP